VDHDDTPATTGGQEKAMYQLTQLADGQYRQQLAHAEQRLRRAARQARRLGVRLHAHTATGP
jgi:hypothetical protein